MINRTLYDLSEIEVYIEYFKYLNKFGRLNIDKETYDKLIDLYNDYLINLGDRNLYREIMLIVSKLIPDYYSKFSLLIKVNYLNEYLRRNYKILNDFYSTVDIEPIKTISKFNNNFNDELIDYYLEELKLHENNNVINELLILNKISELFNIINILYKQKQISEELYSRIYKSYKNILESEDLVYENDSIKNIIDWFSLNINTFTYQKKKIKKN